MASPAIPHEIGGDAEQIAPLRGLIRLRKLAGKESAISFLQQILGYGAFPGNAQQVSEEPGCRTLVEQAKAFLVHPQPNSCDPSIVRRTSGRRFEAHQSWWR